MLKNILGSFELQVNNKGNFLKVNCFKMKTLTMRALTNDTFTAIVFNANDNFESYEFIVDNAIISLVGYGLFKIKITDYKEYKLISGEQIDSKCVQSDAIIRSVNDLADELKKYCLIS